MKSSSIISLIIVAVILVCADATQAELAFRTTFNDAVHVDPNGTYEATGILGDGDYVWLKAGSTDFATVAGQGGGANKAIVFNENRDILSVKRWLSPMDQFDDVDLTQAASGMSFGYWLMADLTSNSPMCLLITRWGDLPIGNTYITHGLRSNGAAAPYTSRRVAMEDRDTSSPATEMTADQWHHLVFTYSAGAPGSVEKEMYIDGVSVYTSPADTSITLTTSGSHKIGGFWKRPSYIEHFYGVLDQFDVWDTDLSDAEVLAEYNAGPMVVGNRVAMPTFNPPGDTYTQITSITISCATAGATIYYTTDGSTPTTGSPVYTVPITVDQDMTIQAMAAKSSMIESNIGLADYIISYSSTGGLVGYWRFDNSANLAQESARGIPVSTITNVTQGTGKIGTGCGIFGDDPSLAGILIDNDSVLCRALNGQTVATWIKVPETHRAGQASIFHNNSHLAFRFQDYQNFSLRGHTVTDAGTVHGTKDVPQINDGQWHHLAFVANVAPMKKGFLYVDGNEVYNWDLPAAATVITETTRWYVGIGNYYPALKQSIGQLDDFRIYDYPLSSAEINELFQKVGQETAMDPFPYEGAQEHNLNLVLKWTPGDDANSHDVYFGTNFDDVNDANQLSTQYKGNQTFGVNSYDPYGTGPLVLDQAYYWRIDEVSDANDCSKGRVWNFTTSAKAFNPDPAHKAIIIMDPNVESDIVLSWAPGFDANSHDVYFGTNFDDVNDADKLSDEYKDTHAFDANSYDPSVFVANKTYFWRIDEVDDSNDVTKGDIWHFRMVGKYYSPYDIGIEKVWNDLKNFASNWLQQDCNDCGGADLDFNSNVDLLDYGLFAQRWLQKPEFSLNTPTFDSNNRPYIRSRSDDVHTTEFVHTIRDGKWVALNFIDDIQAAYPDFSETWFSGGRFSTRVIFDVDDDAYTIVQIKLNDGSAKNLLLYSRDYCQSWQIYELPDPAFKGEYGIEHAASSSSNPLPEPPAIISWDYPSNLSLIIPTKTQDGLQLSGPELISSTALRYIALAGGSSFAVTRNGKTHLAWIEEEDGQVPYGTPTYAATYDRQTGTLGQKVLVAYALGNTINDVHNMPGICIDSQGYLHLITGSNAKNFFYSKSNQPDNVNGTWTVPETIITTGWVDNSGERARQTYVALVCDKDDTLHLVFNHIRKAVIGDHFSDFTAGTYFLSYLSKKKTGSWQQESLTLVLPPILDYTNYYHKLAVDLKERLYLSYSPYILSWDGTTSIHKYRSMLFSGDGGNTWDLATTQDFLDGMR